MQKDKSSATSLGVAGLRAAHQLIDGQPKLLDDPAVLRLLGQEWSAKILQHLSTYQAPAAMHLRSHVLLRSRYAEDCLSEAYARGVRQYILLGAGLDTYAWRQPPGLAELRIFEVDHPATQEQKRQLLEKAGLATPDNVYFIPTDFESTSIGEALDRSPDTSPDRPDFDPTLPCFISWLGVMVYLTMEAIDAVFDWLLTQPAGSEMVLTFTRKRELSVLGDKAAALGEPWQTFFTPEELREKLLHRGFSSVHILEPREAWQTYYAGRTDGLPAPSHPSIARIMA
jgi:methyltransferase (TIGR00027 family)